MSVIARETSVAHPNIALIKYWGKRDSHLVLPYNSSLSLTLDIHPTTTTVTLDDTRDNDVFTLNGVTAGTTETARISRFLDIVREYSGSSAHADIQSNNMGPTAAGLASSASGFAALAHAASRAYNLDLSPRELSRLARRGSGSASRSIFGGLVVWHAGTSDENSYAEQIDSSSLDLAMIVIILSDKQKKISSRAGMERTVSTSPFYFQWVTSATEDLASMRDAIRSGDFERMGELTESNAMKMHATTLGARPPFTYFGPESLRTLQVVRDLRDEGISCWATMDAGPNVKVLCRRSECERLVCELRKRLIDVLITPAFPGPGVMQCST